MQNSLNEVLLMLRDDKPTIRYPNQWITLGGRVEDGESPEDAIKREMMEEIEFDLTNFILFKVYDWPEKKEWVYYARVDLVPENINLHEGQMIKYFSWEEIEKMDLAFHDNDILKDYFQG